MNIPSPDDALKSSATVPESTVPEPQTESDPESLVTRPNPVGRADCQDDAQDAMEVENLIESYQILAEWIRFADAKAAAVLTVNGVLAGVLIPPLRGYLAAESTHPTERWGMIVTAAFLAWLVTMLLSSVFAFRCILPYSRRGKHPAVGHANHFHPAAIARQYRIDQIDAFVTDVEQIGMTGLKKQVSTCMLVDSHISNHKYNNVSRAIRMLGLSAVIGLLYLLSIQF